MQVRKNGPPVIGRVRKIEDFNSRIEVITVEDLLKALYFHDIRHQRRRATGK
jgi:hypothetical protein